MSEITQDLLKELFEYRDGNLYWKVAKQGINIVDLAGYADKLGYRRIGIHYKTYYAHRLIFLYHHGYLPKYLDHIDGDQLNNNINNLREATIQENAFNRKKTESYGGKPTSSKYKGVCWDKAAKKWVAEIRVDRKKKHLGRFVSEIKAAKAYNIEAIKHRREFAKPSDISIIE